MSIYTPERRGFLLAMAATALDPVLARSQPTSAPASAGPASPALIEDLVIANRILFDQGVVDSFGHVSVRHDKNPERFLISRNLAPNAVTAADIMEYDLDGNPVDAHGRASYLERFIHGSIYRARKDVNSVVHSHSAGVIPFGVSDTPLRPIYHMAGFIGGPAPVFEIRDKFGPSTDMLIRNPKMGAALAEVLGNHTVVLMRGHGSVAVGPNVRLAVMHAVYTEVNARLQAEAIKLGKVNYLDADEAAKTQATNDGQVERAWSSWRAKALAANPIR
jgi:ribulose-5-phosphate 4-epimerase/fuculose-1-phosphate aldolase